jgi:hypothetical protein
VFAATALAVRQYHGFHYRYDDSGAAGCQAGRGTSPIRRCGAWGAKRCQEKSLRRKRTLSAVPAIYPWSYQRCNHVIMLGIEFFYPLNTEYWTYFDNFSSPSI